MEKNVVKITFEVGSYTTPKCKCYIVTALSKVTMYIRLMHYGVVAVFGKNTFYFT